jgi:hypothetical protein
MGPPPRVAVCESVYAAIPDKGGHLSVIATAVRATAGMRTKRRLISWSATGWVLPTVDLIGGGDKVAD